MVIRCSIYYHFDILMDPVVWNGFNSCFSTNTTFAFVVDLTPFGRLATGFMPAYQQLFSNGYICQLHGVETQSLVPPLDYITICSLNLYSTNADLNSCEYILAYHTHCQLGIMCLRYYDNHYHAILECAQYCHSSIYTSNQFAIGSILHANHVFCLIELSVHTLVCQHITLPALIPF